MITNGMLKSRDPGITPSVDKSLSLSVTGDASVCPGISIMYVQKRIMKSRINLYLPEITENPPTR